jgi:hypothetical protein
MQIGFYLSRDDCPFVHDVEQVLTFSPYSQIVGSLMNAIVNSRTNCVCLVKNLAQYLFNLNETHIQALKRTI